MGALLATAHRRLHPRPRPYARVIARDTQEVERRGELDVEMTRSERITASVRGVALSPRLVWAIVVLGIVLRTIRYFSDRSLWLDESYLALNVLGRSYSQLSGSLDFNQGAPVGFLYLEK